MHYIEQVLNRVKFGPTFQKLFQILYNGVSSCVIKNGTSSSYFTLGRVVLQGYPLSGYLFIIGLGMLSIAIRTNEDIERITVLGKHIKLAQNADDMNNSLSNENSTHTLFSFLEQFER